VTVVRAAAAALALLALAACNTGTREEELAAAASMTGGNPNHGPALMRSYGCASCHTIPGVDGANSTVGPPLTNIAVRGYIAGVLPNAPDNMIRWIRDPRGVDSLTAMPNTGVTEHDARDIAAYLYTLR
jgi:cytochrome c